MADRAQRSADAETPVNPYSLLEAVNSSSDTAHTGWLIFLAIMTYLVIAVAGVTHEALLMETPVELPILQVKIQLKQFFQFAPIVLVLFHLGILAQLVLLARKAIEFDHAIGFLEVSGKRTHPLRLELHNFFFVQGIAGPQRSALMNGFLNIMSWLTIVILPVVLLLYMQVAFLPYHDVTTTWINRVFLTLDIVGVLLIGVFLMRAETSFFQAFWRSTAAHPLSVVTTTIVLAAVAYLSYFAATVPGERLDGIGRKLTAWSAAADAGPVQQSSFALPFLAGDDALFGIFRRNLDVTDSDLVGEEGGKNLRLRGRDLRYAKLDRTDLSGADLTGTRLDGASLIGANLEKASLGCAEPDTVMLSDNRVAGRCVSARNTDLTRARLGHARLWGADLTGAKLDDAQLDSADLGNAILTGASLANAHLDKAELTGGVQAQAANFLNASLQGADLTGARLQLADFSSASLQGALLNFAQLDGAVLRDANLEATSLQQATLVAADMNGMRTAGSDMRGAVIWMSQTPVWDRTGLTDLSELVVRSPSEAERANLKASLERIPQGEGRVRADEFLAMLAERDGSWKGSSEQQRWQSWAGATPVPPALNYTADITAHLTKLMCSARWSDGAIATGIARRAVAPKFRGDVVAVYDTLRANTCPAAAQTPDKVMRELSSAAESARN
ncbi:MAG TPA: pentapeptide repeat-containing protein [Hyphomicrobium sp.]|nr:pentapeptide repeat-containing protein [Hyphomicrobium sp.]